MIMTTKENFHSQAEDGFSRPVESIMRCEDFKSNFARRLSNRYISRNLGTEIKPDDSRKMKSVELTSSENVQKVTIGADVSTISNIKKVDPVESETPPQSNSVPKQNTNNIRRPEVTALLMEVETLRWQLAQTEANRQMYLALLKQIITLLNKIRDHMECQKKEFAKEDKLPLRVLPRSLNSSDLPRSRSVLNVNKNLELTLSPVKRFHSRKLSQSISNVNGLKDLNYCSSHKLNSSQDKHLEKKLTEEISRLITLANTVLSTKLPDLACTCTNDSKTEENITEQKTNCVKVPKEKLDLIKENCASNMFILNTSCSDSGDYNSITNKYIESMDSNSNTYLTTPSSLTCGLESDFAAISENSSTYIINDKFSRKQSQNKPKPAKDIENVGSNVANFVEDESGFSSMNSFQEIGIPIINVIPPTPNKEVFNIDDIDEIREKWKPNLTIDLDKTVQVFWV